MPGRYFDYKVLDFLSRLKAIGSELMADYDMGARTIHSRFAERYLKRFTSSEDMLYFNTLWFHNNYRLMEKRGCPLFYMLRVFVRKVGDRMLKKYCLPISDLFINSLNDDHRNAIHDYIEYGATVPEHLDVIPTLELLIRRMKTVFRDDFERVSEECVYLVFLTAESLSICEHFFLLLLPSSALELVLKSSSLKEDDRMVMYDHGRESLILHLRRGKHSSAKVLLRHGFPYYFQENYYSKCTLKFQVCSIIENWVHLEFIRESAIKRGNLRYQIALEVLHAVLCPKVTRQYKRLISLIWNTVPHPFITEQEMFELLNPIFRGQHRALRYKGLKDLCAAYAMRNKIFPVPAVKTPRSLKHLARLQVRQQLFDACNLFYEEVHSLFCFSEELQRYVWYLEGF